MSIGSLNSPAANSGRQALNAAEVNESARKEIENGSQELKAEPMSAEDLHDVAESLDSFMSILQTSISLWSAG